MMFQDNLSFQSSRVKQSSSLAWPPKIEPISCLETSVWNYNWMLCKVSGGHTSHLYHGNLKTCKWGLLNFCPPLMMCVLHADRNQRLAVNLLALSKLWIVQFWDKLGLLYNLDNSWTIWFDHLWTSVQGLNYGTCQDAWLSQAFDKFAFILPM